MVPTAEPDLADQHKKTLGCADKCPRSVARSPASSCDEYCATTKLKLWHIHDPVPRSWLLLWMVQACYESWLRSSSYLQVAMEVEKNIHVCLRLSISTTFRSHETLHPLHQINAGSRHAANFNILVNLARLIDLVATTHCYSMRWLCRGEDYVVKQCLNRSYYVYQVLNPSKMQEGFSSATQENELEGIVPWIVAIESFILEHQSTQSKASALPTEVQAQARQSTIVGTKLTISIGKPGV